MYHDSPVNIDGARALEMARTVALDALWGLSAEATTWMVGTASIHHCSADRLVITVDATAEGNYPRRYHRCAYRSVTVTFAPAPNGRWCLLGRPKL